MLFISLDNENKINDQRGREQTGNSSIDWGMMCDVLYLVMSGLVLSLKAVAFMLFFCFVHTHTLSYRHLETAAKRWVVYS